MRTADVTIGLSYEERSDLLYILSKARQLFPGGDNPLEKRFRDNLDTIASYVSSTRCQEGGCDYCGGRYDEHDYDC